MHISCPARGRCPYRNGQSEHTEPKMERCCQRLLSATPTTAMGMASHPSGASLGKPLAPSPRPLSTASVPSLRLGVRTHAHRSLRLPEGREETVEALLLLSRVKGTCQKRGWTTPCLAYSDKEKAHASAGRDSGGSLS